MKKGTLFVLPAAVVLAFGLACGGGEQPGSDLPNDWEKIKDKAKRQAAKAKQAAAKAKSKDKGKNKGKKKKN